MSSPYHVVYRGNDHVIDFLPGSLLTDQLTGNAVTGATVTVRIADADDNELLDETPMDAVGGEDGNYRATIPDDLDLSAYDGAIAEVSADAGAGAKAFWKLTVKVEDRD